MSVVADTQTDIQFLHDLVSITSVSGNERAASEMFVRHSIQLGMRARVDEVGNAIAELGALDQDHQIHIVLLGHIDTVPGDIPVRIEDGVLHGRGSVDAKGPLATMLGAAHRVNLPDGVRLSVVGAVGEEAAGSIGARHLVNLWNPDACVIGEPSGYDGVTLGYKGRLLCNAKLTRENSHSAGAECSASDELIAWWNRVQDYVCAHNNGVERVFDQIQSSVQSMDSNCDGMMQHATLETGFRLPVGVEVESLIESIRAMGSDGIELEYFGAENAHLSDRNDPVVRAISSSIRTNGYRPRPKQKTGTADMNVVAPIWDCPIAAYGPGDSSLDHTPNEHLIIEDFERSIIILTCAIEELAIELLEERSS